MKFVHLNEYKQTDVIAEFFPEKGFGGTPQKLGRGNYQVKQMCEKPAAVKLCNEFASVVFYENADQTGKRALVNNDCANLAEALTFEPAVITVTLHAQGIKDGKRVATVLFGTYETKVFADYDKVIVPEGMYIVFYGNDADKNALRRYTNESFTVDADLAAYPRAAVMILGDIDALIGLSETELSAEELLSVAGGIQEESDIPPQLGGICMIEGCAAKACAADAPCYVNS